jgi:hypothetical protein
MELLHPTKTSVENVRFWPFLASFEWALEEKFGIHNGIIVMSASEGDGKNINISHKGRKEAQEC